MWTAITRDFYRIFDETFLGIFPDFVDGQRVARRAGAFSGAFGRGSFDRTAHPGRHAAGDHRQRLHRQFSELRFGNGLYLSHQTPQFGARLAQRFRKPGSAHRPLTGFLTDRPFAAGILS